MKVYKQEKLENGIAIDPLKAVHVVKVFLQWRGLSQKANNNKSSASSYINVHMYFTFIAVLKQFG